MDRIKNKEPIARLYAKVFAGEPWKEVSRCSVCGGFSSSEPGESQKCANKNAPGCTGTYSQAAYPEKETVASISKELAKPNAEGIVQVKMEDVRMTIEAYLAFAWGYGLDAQQLAEDKYKTGEMQQIVRDLLTKSGAFFYVSEVGVDPEKRGVGIGKNLTRSLLDSRSAQQFPVAVLRTNENSPMRYIAEKLGMKPVVGLQTGLKDTENEERVLYVGGKYV